MEWFRLLIFTAVALVAWQYPLYEARLRSSTAAVGVTQKFCFEVMGPAMMVRMRPPAALMTFCSAVLPKAVVRSDFERHSSILVLFRNVERRHNAALARGALHAWAPPRLSELAQSLEAASWIQIFPSVILLGPQSAVAFTGLVVAATVASQPVAVTALSWACWALTALMWVDWLAQRPAGEGVVWKASRACVSLGSSLILSTLITFATVAGLASAGSSLSFAL